MGQDNLKTHDGLPAVKNDKGEDMSEYSITVTDPRLNGGKPTNIPSLWGGQIVSEDEAVENALNTKNEYRSFESIKEAVDDAIRKSEAGGANAPKKYAKGGNVEQMNKLFADGGMMDDSGEQVNGVEVPPGSLREEVADDIPAQLSEGEFVVPADVVRYIGLEKLMAMRDKAKQGLERMEEMGQMGNADEVANPDQTFNEQGDEDFAAEIDDIMAEEGEGYAKGGIVTADNVDKMGWARNPAVDVRYFKHEDGRIMFITYINGKPTTSIPEGFKQTDTPVEKLVGKAADDKATTTGPVSTGGGDSNQGVTSNYWAEREEALIAEASAKYGSELGKQIGKQLAFEEQSARNQQINDFLSSAARKSPLGIIAGKISDAAMGTTNGLLPSDKAAPVTTIDISKAQPIVPGGAPVISSKDLPSVSRNTTPVVGIDVSKAAPVTPGGAPVISSGPGSTVTVGGGRDGADTADPGMPSAPAPPAGNNPDEADPSDTSGGGGGGGGDSAGGNNGGTRDTTGSDSHICTASYNQALITPSHFRSLNGYGARLRKEDPYLMRAYDSFGPVLASRVGKSKLMTGVAKFMTSYWKDTYKNNTLSTKQVVHLKLSTYVLRPVARVLGWILIKFIDKK
jgi:hypothetical protein